MALNGSEPVNVACNWTESTPNALLGQAIRVKLPEAAMAGAQYNITFHYTTN
jgi:hypothetical protein